MPALTILHNIHFCRVPQTGPHHRCWCLLLRARPSAQDLRWYSIYLSCDTGTTAHIKVTIHQRNISSRSLRVVCRQLAIMIHIQQIYVKYRCSLGLFSRRDTGNRITGLNAGVHIWQLFQAKTRSLVSIEAHNGKF